MNPNSVRAGIIQNLREDAPYPHLNRRKQQQNSLKSHFISSPQHFRQSLLGLNIIVVTNTIIRYVSVPNSILHKRERLQAYHGALYPLMDCRSIAQVG